MIDSRKDDVFTCVSSGFCQRSSSPFLSLSSPSALVITTLKLHNKKEYIQDLHIPLYYLLP